MNKYTISFFAGEDIIIEANGYYESNGLITFYIYNENNNNVPIASGNLSSIRTVIMNPVPADGSRAISNEPTI